jgi:hypothetical protein
MPCTACASRTNYCYHILNRDNGPATAFHKPAGCEAIVGLFERPASAYKRPPHSGRARSAQIRLQHGRAMAYQSTYAESRQRLQKTFRRRIMLVQQQVAVCGTFADRFAGPGV